MSDEIQTPTANQPAPVQSETSQPVENPAIAEAKARELVGATKGRNWLPIILIIVVLLLLGGGAVAGMTIFKDQIPLLASKPTPTPELIPTIIPTPTPTLTPEITPSWQINDTSNTNLKELISGSLGISFTYLVKQNDWTILVKGIGSNKICLTYDENDVDCSKGQSVEVFKKEKADTLEQAIKKQFLVGYLEKDCFVKAQVLKKMPSNFESAIITFPESTDPSGNPWQNAEKCPNLYTSTNGISYFLMDKNSPEKLLFFNIGQYGIMSDSNNVWQDTIKILN